MKKEIITGELLSIQKLILLLNDSHLDYLVKYLKEQNAQLSIKLIELILKHGHQIDTNRLCKYLYGKEDSKTKHKFNQLASHTFKSSSILSDNYPTYLHHNIDKLVEYVNAGKIEKANFLAEILYDIAEKICDFQTQIFCLRFLYQQAYLNKEFSLGLRHHKMLIDVINDELLYEKLNYHFRENLNPANANEHSEKELLEKLDYYKPYFNCKISSIRLISKFAYLSGLFYFFPKVFESHDVYSGFLIDTLKDFHNNRYVTFHFLSDLPTFLMFYRINTPHFDLDDKKNKEVFNEWGKHYKSVNFWKHYLNQPEIFSINIKANYYISKYFQFAHKKNSTVYLKESQVKDLDEQVIFCEKILLQTNLQEKFDKYLISIKPVYASLIIIHPGKSTKFAVEYLESLLTSYQQTSFGIVVDNIFTWLMVGYFSLKKFDECVDTFNRYTKSTKGRVYYETNDITIHFYYYLSKWLASGRKQYLKKLTNLFERAEKIESPHAVKTILKQIASDFNVPLD